MGIHSHSVCHVTICCQRGENAKINTENFSYELKLKIYISVRELSTEAIFNCISFRRLGFHNFFRAGSSVGISCILCALFPGNLRKQASGLNVIYRRHSVKVWQSHAGSQAVWADIL